MPCLCCCSIEEVLHNIDTAIQYGEDAEVKVRDMDREGIAGDEDSQYAGDD